MPKATIQTVIETPPTPEENSQPVLAYRVGQLEKAVTGGMNELKDEIRNLTASFTPQSRTDELKQEGDKTHRELQGQIDTLKTDTDKRFSNVWSNFKWSVGIILAIATLVITYLATTK